MLYLKQIVYLYAAGINFYILKQIKLRIMKKAISRPVKSISMLIASMVLSLMTFAQDKKVDIDINTKSGNDNFFMQPWVWIVGGAVFLLLLVALLRNNSNK